MSSSNLDVFLIAFSSMNAGSFTVNPLSPIVTSTKFLLIISMYYNTYRSGEFGK